MIVAGIVAALALLTAGVAIGVFLASQQADAAPSAATPSASDRGVTGIEALRDEPGYEKASTAPTRQAGPPEQTGECPEGEVEVYRGATSGHSAKLCATPANPELYTYVGGSEKSGYLVLSTTMRMEPGAGATFTAENGVTSYTIDQHRLLVERNGAEGHSVVVDEEWETGNMGNLDVMDTEGNPMCAVDGYDPGINDGIPPCPELQR